MAMYGQGYGQGYGGYNSPVPDQLAMYRQPYVQGGGYQQGYPQGQNMPHSIPQNEPMTWVQGEAGAKAYIVAPGNTAVLWDSEAEVIYIKSANAAGMPYMRVFDYRERTGATAAPSAAFQNSNDYVTRGEFEALTARINELSALGREKKDGEQAI